MDGFYVEQPLPAAGLNMVDPFLLIHHATTAIQSGSNVRDLGVGPHPHRGFSPVTFVYRGEIHHRDSRGNSGIVGPGGTQWMHSGMGIIHSERPSRQMAKEGGTMEIVQFWVNVPREYKMDQPYYTPLGASETPRKVLEDGASNVQVISGEYGGIAGRIKTPTPLLLLRISLRTGALLELPVPGSYNLLVYELNGRVLVNEEVYSKEKQLTFFENDGDGISILANEDSELILLSGEPVGEKVVRQGPFVMTSETEIMEAMRDYQMGKMGFLIEEFD